MKSVFISTLLIVASNLYSSTLLAQDSESNKSCPDTFHQLPLYPKAKLCQMFDGDFPATLTYHARTDLNSAADFYLEKLGQTNKDEWIKGRRILHFKNDSPIIIISQDGAGSQIDVLMKQAL